MPEVGLTIITVCFRSAPLLARTIANVAAFKRADRRYIVIDGGSDDGTVELLERSAEVVDCWVSEADRGIYDAMNKGWCLAEPESRILFLGAGDEILSLPDNLASYPRDTVLYGDVMVGERRFRSVADMRLKFSNTLHHQALMVPKRLHLPPPFDTGYRVYADYDFTLRLLKQGVQFVHTAELMAYAEPGGVSATKQHGENFTIVRRNLGITMAICSTLFLTLRKLLACLGIRVLAV